MLDPIVSLLTGILEELKALRETYTSALNEGRAMRQETISTAKAVQEAVQAATKTEPLQTASPKEQAPAPEPFSAGNTAAAQPTPVTRDVCGQALVQLATDKNRDAAVAVLAKFNAKLVKEVQEKDLLAFYAAVQEALK